MSLDIPNLQILEIKNLIPHERHDHQRTPPLIERLRSSGLLGNPPIVTPFSDGSNQYMVLDGANRTAALKGMGVPHVIAQVVDSKDKTVELKTWNHVLWDMDPNELIKYLQQIDNLTMSVNKNDKHDGKGMEWGSGEFIWVETADRQIWVGKCKENELSQRVNILNEIVNTYKNNAKMDRTASTSAKEFNHLYDDFCAVIVFPHFEVSEILKLCKAGSLLPTGITRFTITPRALRVNYPLDYLLAEKTLEEKNRNLAQWIQERIARKGVRVYAEATVLFDE